MRNEPASAFTLGSFAGLALLLLLLVLEEPSPLALLNDSGSHDLSPEAVEQPLLRLVLFHHHLHVVRRPEEQRLRVRVGRVCHGGHLRQRVVVVALAVLLLGA